MNDATEESPNDIVVMTIRMPRRIKSSLEERKNYTGMSMNSIACYILSVGLRAKE